MEQNELLNKLAKLREELQTAVKEPEARASRQSVDLNSYLHSQRSRTSIEYPGAKTEYSYWKLLLDEKQQRIDELEESMRSMRVEYEKKESDMKAKYEEAIHSIKTNCESLSEFYEMRISEVSAKAVNTGSFENEIEVDRLKRENVTMMQEIAALKKEVALVKLDNSKLEKLKSEQEDQIFTLKQELLSTKDHLVNTESELETFRSNTELLQTSESLNSKAIKEIHNLESIKESLETEIDNLEHKREQVLHEIVSDYDSKLSHLQHKAEFYKSRYKHVLMKFFTLLRTLKMDIFEVKHRVITWLEEALTETSTIVAAVTRYHKVKVEDLEKCMQEFVKENHKLRSNKSRKGI